MRLGGEDQDAGGGLRVSDRGRSQGGGGVSFFHGDGPTYGGAGNSGSSGGSGESRDLLDVMPINLNLCLFFFASRTMNQLPSR